MTEAFAHSLYVILEHFRLSVLQNNSFVITLDLFGVQVYCFGLSTEFVLVGEGG